MYWNAVYGRYASGMNDSGCIINNLIYGKLLQELYYGSVTKTYPNKPVEIVYPGACI